MAKEFKPVAGSKASKNYLRTLESVETPDGRTFYRKPSEDEDQSRYYFDQNNVITFSLKDKENVAYYLGKYKTSYESKLVPGATGTLVFQKDGTLLYLSPKKGKTVNELVNPSVMIVEMYDEEDGTTTMGYFIINGRAEIHDEVLLKELFG